MRQASAADRALLRALMDMTAEPSPLARLVIRARKALKLNPGEPTPFAELAGRLRDALMPGEPFDATAWAERVVRVEPAKQGGASILIGGVIEEHWTGMVAAHASAERIRKALIASLPENLVSK